MTDQEAEIQLYLCSEGITEQQLSNLIDILVYRSEIRNKYAEVTKYITDISKVDKH